MPLQKLFLLDAMALIYRAHFAFSQNPRINSKGLNTSATFGFANTLLEVLQKEKPTHIAVCFDMSGPTFRHEQFAEYKAQRQEQPEDISINIPLVKQLVRAMNITLLELQGFEADDIIGTLAKKFASENCHVYMMTPDKDYCQLVTEHIFVFKPAFMGKPAEALDVAKVLEKFGIKHPDQVRDILGLQGDSVDNIPGIPGIGEKTAQKLIAEYETVENLIANADKLSGKQKENVVNFAAQGIMSKELATIHIGVPVAVDFENLKVTEPNKENLSQLLDEFEFRQMKAKLLPSEGSEAKASPAKKATKSPAVAGQFGLFDAPTEPKKVESEAFAKDENQTFEPIVSIQSQTIDDISHDYHLVKTKEERTELIKYLLLQTELCFDTETTSTDAIRAELVGLSISYYQSEAFYIPIPADKKEAQEIVNEFKDVFLNENCTKIGHNIKYDILVLGNYGIEVKGKLFDTMLAHYLIEPDQRHGMDILAKSFLNYSPISITELIGKKGVSQGNMRDVEIEKVAVYAAEDADITLKLKHTFEPLLKSAQLEPLFQSIENPLIYVLADMERDGVKIDTTVLSEISDILGKESILAEDKIYELAGEKFNVASPKQLGIILFEKLKLEDKPKKTETGQYATGEEILSKLAYEHPIAAQILEYRELQKLKSTYVDALPLLINPHTGMVHTSYNQAVAATGRLSSTDPNLQNIPIRTDRGKEIRKAFIPRDKDSVILSADYSQIELRIMASFSKDESMIAAFRNGVDIHSTTASKVFKVGLEEVTSDMRRKAKMVNFGIIYGISAFGLAQRLSIPRKEAGEIIDAYWKEFPAVRNFMSECIDNARETEYVTTISARRRYLRDINSRNMTVRGYAERNAINAPIQGSAADIIKKAMIDIHAWMKKEKLRSKMVLQVHDELVFDVYQSELEQIKPYIENFMKNAIPLEVPMEIGMGSGVNWLVAH
ncbi:MAG: DNA polymerase I [Cytophagales bacterium]|nr:MAG: DNA polymerase I [Cytophagales bacterium]